METQCLRSVQVVARPRAAAPGSDARPGLGRLSLRHFFQPHSILRASEGSAADTGPQRRRRRGQSLPGRGGPDRGQIDIDEFLVE